VHLKVPPTTLQCGPFHQQLVWIQDRVAGITLFAIAWTTPSRSYAVMRQTTVGELAPYEETEGFVVQRVGLSGLGNEARQIHLDLSAQERQPVRPGCRQGEGRTDA
jgi:hypothetical protein